MQILRGQYRRASVRLIFSSVKKGIIDLIPAAVEAVKQETVKKMKLFSSDGKALSYHING